MPRLWSPSEYSASLYSASDFGARPVETQQRSGNRFSAFFHGTSVLTDRTGRPLQHDREPLGNDSSAVLPRLDMSHLNTNAPDRRSPTSTRSLIDPSSTPASSVRSFSATAFNGSAEISPLSAQVHLLSPRTEDLWPEPLVRRKTVRRVRHAPRWRPRHSSGLICFPFMRKRGMRRRVFYCFLSGFILVISLIIFLALLVSNTVAGQEFRIVLILFLLIFTVVFCHSLIRLCLATFNSRKGSRTQRRGRVDTERIQEFDQPVPVVLARDEEMALGGYEDREDKNLPPPPPAYGLWRGSVRIDPNLLRWQRAKDFSVRTTPAEETADAFNRPPSYMLDHSLGYSYRSV